MLRLLKNFLLYTPTERRGILLLICLIALTVGGGWWWRSNQMQQPVEERSDSLISHFTDSIQSVTGTGRERGKRIQSLQQTGDNTSFGGNTTYSADTLFAFNPNEADSVTLVRLGFTPWMARNLLKYRAKGGRFRRTVDLRKLYGMTETLYTRLAPYVTIPVEEQIARSAHGPMQQGSSSQEERRTAKHDSQSTEQPSHRVERPSQSTEQPSVYLPFTDSLYTRVEKYPKGTRIELNWADTTELKKIPGIGSYTARRIATYREKMGGFVRMEQLREIRLNDEVLEPWFTIDTTAIQPLRVNHLSMKQLLSHPYLNYRQSRAIVQYRERHGAIPSLDAMRGWEEFTANELKRVAPYLSFE